MIKQAATVPAEVTPLVITASVGHLNVPEVLRDVRLDLPRETQTSCLLCFISWRCSRGPDKEVFLWSDVTDRHQNVFAVSFE